VACPGPALQQIISNASFDRHCWPRYIPQRLQIREADKVRGQLIAIDSIDSPKDFMQSKALIANHAAINPDTLADVDVELKDMV